MTFSVIIPTCNRSEDLFAAMKSLLQQTLLPKEIIIVDQSSDDSTAHLVQQTAEGSPAGVRITYFHQHYCNSAHARNSGIAHATGDVVSFLDDDVVLSNDYFEQVARYFQSDPRLGGISGDIVNQKFFDGWKWSIRAALMRLFLINNFTGRMTASGFGYAVYNRKITKPIEVEMLTGCGMSFRRVAIADKRFDPWFSGYSYREDADFSYTISREWKLLIVPEVKLCHNVSKRNRMSAAVLRMMKLSNYHYVFRKHKYNGIGSLALFYYSLTGYLMLDAFDFLWGLRKEDFLVFKAAAAAYLKIIKEGLRKG